jgi:DMSO/TMAO reductase YedYZ heme-binding membrane subunit
VRGELWWYVARATGLVAWVFSIASIGWGLALSTRALGKRPKAPWLLDLHRFLGALTVALVVAHMGALVADSYAHFDVADLLLPMASTWKPGPVAWGVVAFWLLLAIEVTSLFMRRLPKRWWRGVHLTSYLVAVTSTVHGLQAGTDAGHPVVRWAWPIASALVVFFTAYRVLHPSRTVARPAPAVVAAAAPAPAAAKTDRAAMLAAARAARAARDESPKSDEPTTPPAPELDRAAMLAAARAARDEARQAS